MIRKEEVEILGGYGNELDYTLRIRGDSWVENPDVTADEMRATLKPPARRLAQVLYENAPGDFFDFLLAELNRLNTEELYDDCPE